MRIKQRKFLVILLIVSQLGCMLFGLASASGWLNRVVTEVIASRVEAEGRSLAHELATKAGELDLESVEPGTKDWQRLQDLCASIEIPHDGAACMLRLDTGAIICHSNLEDDPALLGKFPGRALLSTGTTAAPIITISVEASQLGRRLIAGKVEIDGKLQVFTGYTMPQINALLAIYQSDASIDKAVATLVYPVTQVGYVLTAFIIGASSLLTVFLVGRYENSLAEANSSLEREVDERTQSLLKTRNAVIFGLAKLAESRDKDTGAHLERISSYVTVLATELASNNRDITSAYVANLAVASSLHDIGKVGIPDGVLLKPGRLTPTERQAMEMHTTLGSECLAAIQERLGEDDFLQLAQEIAAAHHEQWNGTGYPNKLQGKSIPLAARIVALADVYDALTTRRPYKQPIEHSEAREWIATRYGTHFDPEVVEAFVAKEAEFARIAADYSQSHANENPKVNICSPTTDTLLRAEQNRQQDRIAEPQVGIELSTTVAPV
ncbi:HD-GYP domain-containing protein [Adhaeretor mobilis]|uniref:Cyclic di-GMP phosphodiesterase response regulator RpfG n=1 Tax=Adhaeretor mobilis TaxID=1930276 RepID=A0A517MVM0_9BACT|nr:HD domain-containing phosphohydrolase [Adhaeretor mobilis]QDS98925.1 Cyclic di-GMP phosphodiesterase response regulator RpfG [Adhaeretor mobilis]